MTVLAIAAMYVLIGTLLAVTIKPKSLFMYLLTIATWPYFAYVVIKEIREAGRK